MGRGIGGDHEVSFRVVALVANGAKVNTVLLGVTAAVASGEVKVMLSVRKKPGEAVGIVLLRNQRGRRSSGSATRADAQKGAEIVGAEYDDVVGAPACAAAVGGIGEDSSRAASRRDLHQLAVGEETEVAAIGRPERMACALRTFELQGRVGTEGADPERFRFGGVSGEGDAIALRGEDGHASGVASGVEDEFVRRGEFDVEGFGVGGGFSRVSGEGGQGC